MAMMRRTSLRAPVTTDVESCLTEAVSAVSRVSMRPKGVRSK